MNAAPIICDPDGAFMLQLNEEQVRYLAWLYDEHRAFVDELTRTDGSRSLRPFSETVLRAVEAAAWRQAQGDDGVRDHRRCDRYAWRFGMRFANPSY
jgi:hypothetical protein